MPSLWFYGSSNKAGGPGNLFRKTDEEDHKAAYIDYKLDVQRPGIFSVIVATDFSDLNVFLSLRKIDSKELIAIEKSYMLDNVETANDHLGRTEDTGVAHFHGGEIVDHLQAIEVDHLDEGRYVLTIQVPRAHFLHEETQSTCLSMKVMMEFIPRDFSASGEDSFLADPSAPVEVISVYPMSTNDLHIGTEMNMMVHFNRPFDVRMAAKSMSDASRLCRLQNVFDFKKYLSPTKYYYDGGDSAKLHFDFAKEGDYIN